MRLLPFALALMAFAATALGQTIVLDNFNAGGTTGAVRAGTSWVNNVTAGANTLTVGGTALNDNGWGATGQTINATGINFFSVTAQRDAGHVASNFVIQFEDRNLNTQVFSVGTSAFATGSLTQVQVPVTWAAGFDRTQIVSWSIGGGSVGTVPFRMTFDQISLTGTANNNAPIVPGVSGDYGTRARAPGESVTFTVTATGSTPLTYQWFKDGTAITGNPSATTATLTLASLNATNAGNYTAVVTNAAGTATSGSFTLTVAATPATVTLGGLAQTFTGSPQSVTATTAPAGLPVTFSYNSSATPPTSAGSYTVVATVNHPSYTGSAQGTLVIARAPQSISYGAFPATLTVGTAHALAATSSSGGVVSFALARGNAQLAGTALTPLDTAQITIRATQAGDSNFLPAVADFSFSAAKQNQSIIFAALTSPVTGTAPVTLAASATSALPITFSVITGPATLTGTTVTPTASGLIIVRASQPGNDTFNPAPDVDRALVVVGVEAPATAPTIARAPASQTVALGAPFTLSVDLGGTAPFTYQWFKDNVALAGATENLLTFGSATAALAGSYSVAVTNRAGTVRSAAAIIIVDETVTAESRLTNFSTRARAGNGDQVVIAGFVISGNTPKPVLVRAVGPTLTTFGVTGVLAAPALELFAEQRSIARNTGWSTNTNPAAVATAAQQVGAFALTATSADSALLATLPPGNYTAVISAADQRAGVGLIEVYDLSSPVRGQKISNLSIRAGAGVDADTLIVGVVVQGTSPKRMLIRAAGPALAGFGVSGVLARPQLAIFSGATEMVRNTGWANSPTIAQAASSVGAFAFTADSLDAALIVTLAPGAYTAQVSGAGGASGVALVEAYELP